MALLRRLVCLAAALSAAHGFVITPNARWSLPVDSRSTAGLSRGLSFVIDSGARNCHHTHLIPLSPSTLSFCRPVRGDAAALYRGEFHRELRGHPRDRASRLPRVERQLAVDLLLQRLAPVRRPVGSGVVRGGDPRVGGRGQRRRPRLARHPQHVGRRAPRHDDGVPSPPRRQDHRRRSHRAVRPRWHVLVPRRQPLQVARLADVRHPGADGLPLPPLPRARRRLAPVARMPLRQEGSPVPRERRRHRPHPAEGRATARVPTSRSPPPSPLCRCASRSTPSTVTSSWS